MHVALRSQNWVGMIDMFPMDVGERDRSLVKHDAVIHHLDMSDLPFLYLNMITNILLYIYNA